MLVIFDCDGVLVDSENLDSEVLVECFATEGVEITEHEIDVRFRGKSVPDCIRLAKEILSELPSWKIKSDEAQESDTGIFWRKKQLRCLEIYQQKLQAIPGVVDVIKMLKQKQIPICVASNGKHEKMAITLAKTDIAQYFGKNVFSFEEVTQGKPAPDLFLHAANTMGVAPENTIVVEDSLSGIKAALAAGMKPLAYCAPQANGDDYYLLPKIKEMNVTWFTDMKQLPRLLSFPKWGTLMNLQKN
jgi:HAD superfamily hydrolase (TIGR01509 family)